MRLFHRETNVFYGESEPFAYKRKPSLNKKNMRR